MRATNPEEQSSSDQDRDEAMRATDFEEQNFPGQDEDDPMTAADLEEMNSFDQDGDEAESFREHVSSYSSRKGLICLALLALQASYVRPPAFLQGCRLSSSCQTLPFKLFPRHPNFPG